MRILFKWILVMSLYGSSLYCLDKLVFPILSFLSSEISQFLMAFMKDHAGLVAIFNFAALFLFMVLENLPYIIFVILTIVSFVISILIVEKIFDLLGISNPND